MIINSYVWCIPRTIIKCLNLIFNIVHFKSSYPPYPSTVGMFLITCLVYHTIIILYTQPYSYQVYYVLIINLQLSQVPSHSLNMNIIVLDNNGNYDAIANISIVI